MGARVGIIGTGWADRVLIPAYQAGGLDVVAVASHDLARARAVADSHGLGRGVGDWRELLDLGLDVIVIGGPPADHLEQARAALSSGTTWCARSRWPWTPAALGLVEAAGAAEGRLALIDHELRFTPARRKAREIIRSGGIGRVVLVTARIANRGSIDPTRPWSWWSDAAQGGGILGALGSHVLDSVRWLVNDDVRLRGATLGRIYPTRLDDAGAAREVTSDDIASLTFEVGDAVGTMLVHGGALDDAIDLFTVRGTEGSVVIDRSLKLYYGKRGGPLKEYRTTLPTWSVPFGLGLRRRQRLLPIPCAARWSAAKPARSTRPPPSATVTPCSGCSTRLGGSPWRRRPRRTAPDVARILALVAVVVLLVASGFWLAARRPHEAAPGTAQAAAPQVPDVPLPDGFTALPYVTDAPQRAFEKAAQVLEPDTDYLAVLNTRRGTITIDLLEDDAPVTVNNFVFLALHRFYDGVPFHRVLDGFMAQTGDPTGTGTGGPGYTFPDEIAPGLSFDERGVVAMANAGPDTNGSQFFITFNAAQWLDGNYNIFGRVVGGDGVSTSSRASTRRTRRPWRGSTTPSPTSRSSASSPRPTGPDRGRRSRRRPRHRGVAGQSLTIAGFRGVVGAVGGAPAVGFFPQPDTLDRVVIATRPAPSGP